jgi:hypothetical protein
VSLGKIRPPTMTRIRHMKKRVSKKGVGEDRGERGWHGCSPQNKTQIWNAVTGGDSWHPCSGNEIKQYHGDGPYLYAYSIMRGTWSGAGKGSNGTENGEEEQHRQQPRCPPASNNAHDRCVNVRRGQDRPRGGAGGQEWKNNLKTGSPKNQPRLRASLVGRSVGRWLAGFGGAAECRRPRLCCSWLE